LRNGYHCKIIVKSRFKNKWEPKIKVFLKDHIENESIKNIKIKVFTLKFLYPLPAFGFLAVGNDFPNVGA
jgi:hypothetical protein